VKFDDQNLATDSIATRGYRRGDSHLRRLALFGLTVGVLTLGGCGAGTSLEKNPAPTEVPQQRNPLQLQAGQIIVAFPDNSATSAARLSERMVDDYDIELSKLWPLSSIGVDCAVFNVRDESSVDSVLDAINRDPAVRVAVKNQRFEVLQSDYNDPYASYQNNVEAIGAELVHHWSTGKKVRVAVVDTGMDVEHPDFSARIVEQTNFVQGGNLSFAQDQHGTAVAGLIAAGANDGVGIFGVAPGAEILAAKACWYPVEGDTKAVCSSWTIARAIDFAINSGAQVINLSLGGPKDDLIESLIETAYRRGIVTIAAAGKLDAQRPMFPASLSTTVAVVASDEEGVDQSAGWEDVGVIVSAPGQEILTTTPGETYNFLSGSSLSTAQVSGAVALLLERKPVAPDRVFSLLSTSMRSGRTSKRFLNICAAMNKLEMSNICS